MQLAALRAESESAYQRYLAAQSAPRYAPKQAVKPEPRRALRAAPAPKRRVTKRASPQSTEAAAAAPAAAPGCRGNPTWCAQAGMPDNSGRRRRTAAGVVGRLHDRRGRRPLDPWAPPLETETATRARKVPALARTIRAAGRSPGARPARSRSRLRIPRCSPSRGKKAFQRLPAHVIASPDGAPLERGPAREERLSEQTKYLMGEDRIPHAWYNIVADLPSPPPPVLHPGTGKPVGPDDLAPLFPMALIGQEVSAERHIEIPAPVRDVYRLWRPTPLYRARRLEKALGTGARIFYKYEGVSPAGSHKPNTAVAQAFYNKQEGVTKLSTETGAGQWGSALAFAGAPLRPRGQGLHGQGLLQPEALPPRPDGDLRGQMRRQPEQRDRFGARDPRPASEFAGQPRDRDFGGGRSRGQERRHQIRARQRPQPCADASDRHRPRGDRADGSRPTPIPTS